MDDSLSGSDRFGGNACFGPKHALKLVVRVFKIERAGISTALRIMGACEQLHAFAKADPSRQVGAPRVGLL